MKKNTYVLTNLIIGLVLGFICFVSIYGFKVLDVTNVDWLKNSGDLTQHYIGWDYFRNEPWTFPIGKISNLIYPFGTSITYMDSIPLFAIIFKLLSPVLPESFQYFGIWGCISFMLAGLFSVLILSKYIKNRFYIFISSILIILSPTCLMKMFIHTALASHWIILAAIAAMVYTDSFKTTFKRILTWSLIVICSVLIHPYLTFIVLVLLLGVSIYTYIINKSIKESLINFLLPSIFGGITFWIIGGFLNTNQEVVYGLGIYSMNLNAWFNPLDWSRILNPLATATEGQYEGFQYLGLGVILLIPICIGLYFKDFTPNLSDFKKFKNKYLKYLIPLGAIYLISLISSLSPCITFNSHKILTFDLPESILKVWSIFRSSGRLFWACTYIFTFILIISMYKKFKSKFVACIVIFIITFIQIYDISSVLKSKNAFFTNEISHANPLQSNLWSELSKKIEHIIVVPFSQNNYDNFSYFAAPNNITLNIGYVAHADNTVLNNETNKSFDDLLKGNYDVNTLFILTDYSLITELKSKKIKDLDIINVNGFTLAFNSKALGINLTK
ncbi:MAG: DUF6311 domain-containing protein [Clostridium chrysemydis]|uniref:DUF6311 domain-containing protein n=1 Tax=Clostridium TaxID=1485 RepID=UPI003F317E4A